MPWHEPSAKHGGSNENSGGASAAGVGGVGSGSGGASSAGEATAGGGVGDGDASIASADATATTMAGDTVTTKPQKSKRLQELRLGRRFTYKCTQYTTILHALRKTFKGEFDGGGDLDSDRRAQQLRN